jgi:nitrite reductase/ring-hydroxylating ferredoxin subunit
MKNITFILLCVALTINQSCKPEDTFTGDCFVQDANVNMTINMDLPEYYNLRNLGEFITLDQGHKGIYLIHNYDDIYYAIERTCTYRSEDACSKIHINTKILQLRCGEPVDSGFVKCCNSTYAYNSGFLSGPTTCPLKTYQVSQSGNSLYIRN